jgi:tRNA G26 N,N-dimethylase Trm1
MFLRGEVNGAKVDNTTEEEIAGWLNALKQIKPKQVMIYTIDRETPVQTLYKVSREEMEKIADRARALGFEVSVSA